MAKVAELNVEIAARFNKLDRGLRESNKKIERFGSKVKSVGRSLVGVFAGVAILNGLRNLIVNSSKLAAEAEGVSEAFDRLNQPGLLNELRDSTKGTVSDLELMKKAVQANNFQIPVKNLGSLFQFAAKRAQQTGESVEFLTNSIVLGIGRKSPLILDNLGISAVRLRKELKGTGVELTTVGDIAAAVGKIASEEMGKSGDIIETTKIKTEQLGAAFENLQTSVGKLINEDGGGSGFIKFLTGLTNGFNEVITGLALGFDRLNRLSPSERIEAIKKELEKLRSLGPGFGDQSENIIELSKRLILAYRELEEQTKKNNDENKRSVGIIAAIKSEIQLLSTLQENATKKELPAINARIEALKQELSLLKFIGTEASKRSPNVSQIQPVSSLAPLQIQPLNEDFISDNIKSKLDTIKKTLNELGQQTSLATSKNIAFGNQYDLVAQKLSLTENAINQLIESGISPQSEAVVNLQNEYIRLNQLYDEQQDKIKNASRASQEFVSLAQTGLSTIFSLLARSNEELSKFEKLLSSSVIGVLSAVLSGGNPLIGLAKGFLGGVGSFASGGVALGPQLAVIGDNPGRKEAIIPSELFGKIGGGDSGGNVEFTIHGNVLKGVLKRQDQLDKRVGNG